MNEINENEMNKFSMLCEDEILEVFYKFRYENSKLTEDEVKVLEKTLRYYKPYFLPTKEQKKCLEILEQKMPSLLDNMTQERHILPRDKALELTKFKVILSTSRSDFPFVNIKDKKNEKLQNNFTASFVSGESRKKALAHFKALLAKATKVEVYDNFLNDSGKNGGKNGGKNWQHFLDVMRQILPQNSNLQMDIFTQNHQNTKKCETDLKNINANLIVNFYSYNTNNTHDRYLIIDNKMEIILTSGFFHLVNPANTGNNIKDFTYVLKEK